MNGSWPQVAWNSATILCLVGWVLVGSLGAGQGRPPETEIQPRSQRLADPAPVSGDPEVAAILERVRREHRLPALGAAIVGPTGAVAVGVAGWRRADALTPVKPDDLWHLGSETKAMTATLVGRLVERGQLDWNTTLAEVFPDWAAAMHPSFRAVSVRQLLAHRAGLPPNAAWSRWRGSQEVRAARLEVAHDALSRSPAYEPGSRPLYSNLGYVVVGAVIEAILDQPWEAAIRREIFEPLGMKSAGFGGVGTPGKLDQPWGHDENGRPVQANGPEVDNPPVMGPAGRVHASLRDWAAFVAEHLRGTRGQGRLLRAATYRVLHTPVEASDWALGWVVTQKSWAHGRALHHTGSNTMNFANAWLAPEAGFAVLLVCNQGGDTAFRGTDAAAAALIPLASRRTAAIPSLTGRTSLSDQERHNVETGGER